MKAVIIISTYPNKKSISKIAKEFVKNKIVHVLTFQKFLQFTLGIIK